jgi:hypothetical protein
MLDSKVAQESPARVFARGYVENSTAVNDGALASSSKQKLWDVEHVLVIGRSMGLAHSRGAVEKARGAEQTLYVSEKH